jgi:hypothetical protein
MFPPLLVFKQSVTNNRALRGTLVKNPSNVEQ